MQTKKIGSLEVSAVGLGCNNFGMRIDEAASAGVLHAALDHGITCIDTADVYGGTNSETWIGAHLDKRRDEAVIVTKFGSALGPDQPGGARPDYVREAAEASLRRLQTDRIDLYLLHRPDPNTPIRDTLSAMNELVSEGKVREIGCSNFSAQQLREADAAVVEGAARFITVQNHYNLLRRRDDAEVVPACEELGIGYMPYFPLASGMLTGKYHRGETAPAGTRLGWMGDSASGLLTDRNFEFVEQLSAWAEARGHSVGELAIAWLASQPAFNSVIAGATRPEQVAENAKAGEWVLAADEVAEVGRITADR
ncbi:MAG TPA: aldo/keto reductase [Acidimicrobiales bacterium]|nr:aldo/keto reductase [Acidimicrobiales bacterium]